MPGADAVVDVKVLGKPLKFVGHGYHDKVCPDRRSLVALILYIAMLTMS